MESPHAHGPIVPYATGLCTAPGRTMHERFRRLCAARASNRACGWSGRLPRPGFLVLIVWWREALQLLQALHGLHGLYRGVIDVCRIEAAALLEGILRQRE